MYLEMRDESYFETRITCSGENAFVCLSHSCANYVPKVGQWAVPPLFIDVFLLRVILWG